MSNFSAYALRAAALALGLASMSLGLADASIAADGPRIAFVVGNGAYAHAAPLKNPPNDAEKMARGLAEVGFEVIRGRDLTRRQFEDKVKEFARRLPGAKDAVFFYAGHGMQVAGQNYLIPVDAKLASERELAFETIPLDLIQTQMELERGDKTSIIFLDACRDNPFTRSLARSMGGTRSNTVLQGLAQMQAGAGTFIAFATRPGDVAQDGSGDNSPFTQSLTSRMKAPGKGLASVMIDVRNDVRRATSNTQVPWDHSSLTGEFYFIPPRVGAPAAVATQAPPDYEAVRRRNEELEKRLAAISKQQVAVATPKAAGPATGPGGCRVVERSLTGAVPVAQGSRLCSPDGVSRADIKVVNRYAIVFSVDGRDTTCKPQDVCQFNWPNAPIFRVRLTEESEGGKVTAELVPHR